MKIKQALLHNTGWRVITMLFTFLNNIIIVRMLGAAESADFFYMLAVFTLLSTVIRVGLENGIVYFITKKPENIRGITFLLITVFIVQIFISIVVLKYFINEIFGYSLFWCVTFVMSNVLLYYVAAFYQAKKMFISLNISGCIMGLCQTLFLFYLYFSGSGFVEKGFGLKSKDNLLLIVSGLGILLQMIFLIFYFYNKHKYYYKLTIKTNNIIIDFFKYSVINFGATVLFFLILRIDLYFVEKYCDKVVLANYLQAAKMGQMLLVFPGLMAGVIFPFTVNAPVALAEKVALLCKILTLVFFIAFIGLLIVGSYIFTWMLGKDFYLMFEIFVAYFLGVFCLSVSLLLISYFEGINKQLIILWALLTTFVIIIIADYMLVPIYGYLAAAIVFSLANFIGTFILLKVFRLKTGITIKKILIPNFKDLKGFKTKNIN